MNSSVTEPALPQTSKASAEGLNIAVVGAGRIGTELVRNLERLGVGQVDVYEKTHDGASALRDRHLVHEGDFWDELTLARLRDYDFAVCTIDDPRARARANQKCLVANVSLVQAWTEDSRAIVAVHPFGADDDCACHECRGTAGVSPLTLAALKLTAAEPTSHPAEGDAAASIAGALAAALIVRVAAGAHGTVARRATLDLATGAGTSVELRRDSGCVRCGTLQRPVPIIHTRNRWLVSSQVVTESPGTLDQPLQLSDPIAGLEDRPVRVGELVERFAGGSIPAKFALTVIGDRVVCLDFEDLERDDTPSADDLAASGRRPAS